MPVRAKPYPTRDELSPEFIDWFWSNVRRVEGDGCWEWLAGKTKKRYGAFVFNGRNLIASRMAFILANGNIRCDLYALHKCDNPPCCRPDHIYAGTHIDNVRDAVARSGQRHHRGATNCNAKLTVEQVASARALHLSGVSGNVLAARFGLSQPSMSKLLRGESYREVDAGCS